MKCQGVFKFKSIAFKEGGSFNIDGKSLESKPGYEVKFDERVDGIPCERKVKIPEDEVGLIKKVQSLKEYENYIFIFDAKFMSKGTSLKLIDVASAKDNSDK